MSQGAHVSSITILESFKGALRRFIEHADKAMVEADLEIQRVAGWIGTECPAYWSGELRAREKELAHARDDLRRVTLTIAEHKPSAVEQKNAVKVAQDRCQQARDKIDTARRWRVNFDRAVHEYRGQVSHVASALESDLPKAAALVDRLADTLEGYLAVAAPATEDTLEKRFEPGQSMANVMRADEPKRARQPMAIPAAAVAALRLRALIDADERADVPPGSPFSDLGESLGPAQARPWLEELIDSSRSPRPGDLVVYQSGALTAGRVCLSRVDVAAPGDSGWYIGHIESDDAPDAPDSHASLTMARILRARPELAPILNLPAGMVAVLNAGRIERLIDARDQSIAAWDQPTVKGPTP